MENFQNSEIRPSTSSCAADYFPVPKLTGDDLYHVFISFSGVDSTWVHRLIHRLEVTFSSIKICSHDRDFTAGKTIIENMTESIQRSQKMLMVLSPDFVQSRWCLFEANLSMFQDCMSHKAIVPVMLKPCPMPLYLSHLTYLEADDEQFFEKLCNRLLRNNAKEAEDVLVHFQSSILYGGKHLLSLAAVNENDKDAIKATFSNTCVPDSLKAVVKDPEIYKKAIQLINDTPTDFFLTNWPKI
ncbi:toll-like receptor 1 [Ranitomeya imitator]|uniref:toll-like receptor 1 n=1 Tax=Ranitomeya imitator TaxID=111125 RepID=UPI0037E98398